MTPEEINKMAVDITTLGQLLMSKCQPYLDPRTKAIPRFDPQALYKQAEELNYMGQCLSIHAVQLANTQGVIIMEKQ